MGQLVFGADADRPTVLATVVQFDPIYVIFNVSERDVLRIRADLASRGQTASANLVGLPVDVGLQSESDNPHKGKLDYITPIVNPTTGTLTARASLANGDQPAARLFGSRSRSPGARPALLVPDVGLGSEQSGRYVLVVNKDSVVEQRKVEQGQLVGNLRVIEKGLTKDDRVIVGGMQAIPGQRSMPSLAPHQQQTSLAPTAAMHTPRPRRVLIRHYALTASCLVCPQTRTSAPISRLGLPRMVTGGAARR